MGASPRWASGSWHSSTPCDSTWPTGSAREGGALASTRAGSCGASCEQETGTPGAAYVACGPPYIARSLVVPVARGVSLSEFVVYLRLGFGHIADPRAYDHILF